MSKHTFQLIESYQYFYVFVSKSSKFWQIIDDWMSIHF